MAQTKRNTTNTTKPADKAANKARKARIAQVVANEAADEAADTGDTADEAAAPLRGWAAEKARALGAVAQTQAAKRCYALAFVLASLAKPGATVGVSFATANELAGLRRGERGDPVGSWVTAVGRMYSLLGRDEAGRVGGFEFAVRVNADTEKLDVTA